MRKNDSNVDYRILSAMSSLVICSRCFRKGRATPIPQLISHRHEVRNLCRACSDDTEMSNTQRLFARYLGR